MAYGSSSRRLALIASTLLLAGGCARSGSSGANGTAGAARARVSWGEPVQVARGPAFRGPWRMNASEYRWVDDPAVDLMGEGDAAVAWVDQARKDLFFQRFSADGTPRLPEPTNVSRSGSTFSWLPRIVAARDPSAHVYLAWQEIVFSGGSHGGEIFFARSADGGLAFTEPLNLSGTREGDGKGRLDAETWDNGSLDLARAPDGTLLVAWTEYEGALWLRRSTDDGATFAARLRLGGTADAPARAPSIAVGPGGGVHVAWSAGEDRRGDVWMTSSTDGGASFTPPHVAIGSDGHADTPKVAVDRRGTVHLVYAASPRGRAGAYHVLHARRPVGADTFERPRRVSAGTEDSATSPSLEIDDAGRVHVLWERRPPGAGRARGLVLTTSTDGGGHFGAPVDVPRIAGGALGWNGSQQGKLAEKLVVAPSGAVAVVNSTFEPDRASHVWLLRGTLAE